MEKEIMEALESAKNDLSKISELVNGLSEKMQESNKTFTFVASNQTFDLKKASLYNSNEIIFYNAPLASHCAVTRQFFIFIIFC